MPEPSASEILGMRVDPEQGGENPVPLLKEGSAIDQLNINARYSAENKWRRYNLFLDNLKGAFKDLNDISGMEVFTPDREYLQKEAGKIYGDLANNPREIFNPATMGRIAKLRSEATESKLNRIFDYGHREFLNRNPELNTEENKKRIEGFGGQPLGKRQAYTLDMPTFFDPTKLRNEIFQSPDVKRAIAESGLVAGGSLINEKTGFQFVRDNFLNKWDDALAYEQDKYGRPIKVWVDEQYNKLNDDQKRAFGGSPESFWKKLGEEAFGSPQDFLHTTKDDLQVNTNYGKDEELRIARSKLGLDWQKYNDEKVEDQYGAANVLNEAKDIISKGADQQLDLGSGKTENVIKIGDPTLLKTFGNIDKDGTVTNVPDAVYYDKSKDQVRLVYYARNPVVTRKDLLKDPDADVYTKTGGDIKTNYYGGNVIDKQVTLDQRTWLKHIAQRSFPNKEIGRINFLVDNILKDNGNSLFGIVSGEQYRNNEANVLKVEGDTVTYKDGSVYKIVGNQMVPVKQ